MKWSCENLDYYSCHPLWTFKTDTMVPKGAGGVGVKIPTLTVDNLNLKYIESDHAGHWYDSHWENINFYTENHRFSGGCRLSNRNDLAWC